MKLEIKIEKEVKFVKESGNLAEFNKLQAGDSFVVPLKKRNCVATSLRQFCKFRGLKWEIRSRQISDTEARIWRIK